MEARNKTKSGWGQAADTAFIDLWEEKARDLHGSRKNSHTYICQNGIVAESIAAGSEH